MDKIADFFMAVPGFFVAQFFALFTGKFNYLVMIVSSFIFWFVGGVLAARYLFF